MTGNERFSSLVALAVVQSSPRLPVRVALGHRTAQLNAQEFRLSGGWLTLHHPNQRSHSPEEQPKADSGQGTQHAEHRNRLQQGVGLLDLGLKLMRHRFIEAQ